MFLSQSDVRRMRSRLHRLTPKIASSILLALMLTGPPVCSGQETAKVKFFQQQVAVILEQNCVSCHHGQKAKGGLNLSQRQHLLRGGESGAAVVVGKPQESLLIDYVSGDKPEMPKNGQSLSGQQIKILRQWIQEGAAWPGDYVVRSKATEWWSYRPLQRPALPLVSDADANWVDNPIDLFIANQLRAHKLTAAPAADRRTLLRRLYYDLTGLPPRPHQVQQFLASTDPLAYEKQVDQLLASPRYGERWGRHWLDVVKYGDTCGYDKDKLRPNAWPYRDYVIRSFNADKPYWQFVQEQLAGDAIFPGTADGILGLGFIAAGPWDFIGHVEVPESKIDGKVARHLDRDDMVSNTFNTFISTTIQCARCHDHKFDPFTQSDYYALQAVFAAVDRAERPYDPHDKTQLQRQQLETRLAQSQQKLDQHRQQLREAGGEEMATNQAEIKRLEGLEKLQDKHPAFGYHSAISKQPGTVKWVQVDLGQSSAIDEIVLHPCHDDFGNIGAGFGFPVRFRIEISDDGKFETGVVLLADRTAGNFPNPGLSPFRVAKVDKSGRYLRVTASRLALRSKDYIFAIAELEVLDTGKRNLALRKPVTALDSIQAPVRWARKNLTDGIWAKTSDPVVSQQLVKLRKQRAVILNRIQTPASRQHGKTLVAHVAEIRKQIDQLAPGQMVYAASTTFKAQGNFKPTQGKPRPIHLLARGNILSPGEVAEPNVPALITAASSRFRLATEHTESDRRVALAKWLTRRDHPLTWRSMANRLWLHHFDQGLVETPNDFGRMGQLPSHPALLDWLACELRTGDQSIKRLHRLIVTSAVYRQSSRTHPGNAAIDSNNRYLWRMNRRRLEAEEIRDSVLSVSNRLNLQMKGPGFYLFKLEKTAHSPHYEYHKYDPNDPRSHRRSVYRFVVRSQPDPFMTTLDCADSSQSTPQRMETLTSLQALALMNNRFTLSMAQHFARRLQREKPDLDAQVMRAMTLITGRTPEPSEHQQLTDYAQQFGLENLCRLLFNLSEFVYID